MSGESEAKKEEDLLAFIDNEARFRLRFEGETENKDGTQDVTLCVTGLELKRIFRALRRL